MFYPRHYHNRRILVIDDNRAIHEDFRKILCSQTDQPKALEDAEAALFGKETAPEVGGRRSEHLTADRRPPASDLRPLARG